MTERRQVVCNSALQVGVVPWKEREQPVWCLNEMKLERGGLGASESIRCMLGPHGHDPLWLSHCAGMFHFWQKSPICS